MFCVVLILDPQHKVKTFPNTSRRKVLQMDAVKYFEKFSNYFQPSPLASSLRPDNEIMLVANLISIYSAYLSNILNIVKKKWFGAMKSTNKPE